MTTIAPNPHSPYADADPQWRHIFPSPVFFPQAAPGVLALTACEGMAVVPETLIETEPGVPLPDGLCPACVTVMNGGKPPKRPSSECKECDAATWHGELCALCRQAKHEAWWPTRDTAPSTETQSPLTAEREQEIRDSIPTVYGPPWTVHPDMDDDVWRVKYATDHPLAGLVCEVPDYGAHLAEFIACARAAVPELLAELDRLRADAAAVLLPVWEAVYEPGNVSDYLIGYANSEAGAKGAAEAWMRSESEVTGRLEWVPQNPLDGYDREFELAERHDDGMDTGPGICVRRRVVEATPAEVTR